MRSEMYWEGGGVKLELLNAILYILLQTPGSFVINLSLTFGVHLYNLYTLQRLQLYQPDWSNP